MIKVSAGEFKKNSGRYQDMAMAEPVAITKHDRPAWVLLSAGEYERLTGNTRRALPVSLLSDEDLDAILSAKIPDEFAILDDETEN